MDIHLSRTTKSRTLLNPAQRCSLVCRYLTLILTYFHQHGCPLHHQRKQLPLCPFQVPAISIQRGEKQARLNEQEWGVGREGGMEMKWR